MFSLVLLFKYILFNRQIKNKNTHLLICNWITYVKIIKFDWNRYITQYWRTRTLGKKIQFFECLCFNLHRQQLFLYSLFDGTRSDTLKKRFYLLVTSKIRRQSTYSKTSFPSVSKNTIQPYTFFLRYGINLHFSHVPKNSIILSISLHMFYPQMKRFYDDYLMSYVMRNRK